MTCRPGHAARHVDFEPGNTVALRAGAWSPRVVEPIAAALIASAATDAPWLLEPKYRAAVEAWARAEAQAQLLDSWLTAKGMHDSQGRLRGTEAALHRAESRAANARTSLGITPLSAARLGRDRASTALDLAHLWAEQDTDTADGKGGGE